MLKLLNRLFERQWFPITFRMLTLVIFVFLVIIGFTSPTKDPFFISQLSNTNLTTSFVWRVWWPMIVLSSIFLGRVWCMVCPVEMITTFYAKIGFKRKRPKWILSGLGITVFYAIVLTVGVTLLEIDQNSVYTSYYLLIIMGVAVLSGLIFEKNTFCRYICPVGYLLGVFSKMAFLGWRVENKAVCNSCTDKSCIKSKYTYQLNYKSCGVDLIPAEIKNNSDCLLCGGCLKTCATYKTENNVSRPNPGIIRIGFANDLKQIQPLRLVEWVFLFLLSGSMIFEMTHFKIITGISSSFTIQKISQFMNLNDGLVKDITGLFYLYLLLPMILWFLPYMMIKLFRIQISLNNYLKRISLVFLPVITAFFVGLVIMEITTKIPYFKYIVHDVRGVETIKAILFGQIKVPTLPSWSDLVFDIVLILSFMTGIIISNKVIRKLIQKLNLNRNKGILYLLPVIFIGVIFASALAYQLF